MWPKQNRPTAGLQRLQHLSYCRWLDVERRCGPSPIMSIFDSYLQQLWLSRERAASDNRDNKLDVANEFGLKVFLSISCLYYDILCERLTFRGEHGRSVNDKVWVHSKDATNLTCITIALSSLDYIQGIVIHNSVNSSFRCISFIGGCTDCKLS